MQKQNFIKKNEKLDAFLNFEVTNSLIIFGGKDDDTDKDTSGNPPPDEDESDR